MVQCVRWVERQLYALLPPLEGSLTWNAHCQAYTRLVHNFEIWQPLPRQLFNLSLQHL